MQPVPFVLESAKGRSSPENAGRLVNVFPQKSPDGSPFPFVLLGSPGLAAWATVGSGPIRGMRLFGGALYVVSGTEAYRVDSSGAGTYLGAIAGAGPVLMSDNGITVLVVAPPNAYSVTTTGVAAVLTDASSGVCQDGYGIFTRVGTGQFYISAINDLITYSALDFATCESNSDNLKRVVSANRELWLFGDRSVEVWYNSGAARFPFARNQSGVLNIGLYSTNSVAVLDNSVFWLGNDGIIYRSVGYLPQRISTHAVEFAIAGYSDAERSSASALTYGQEGHLCYVLNFASGTWVYDLSTGLWHERQTYLLNRWRVACFEQSFGKLLVGDYSTGNIYELSLSTYTDNGTSIQRIMQTVPIGSRGSRFAMSDYQLDCEVGVGLVSGQGSNPQAILEWSDDGARTWSNQHWTSIGAMGRYGQRAIWHRLGAFRQRTMRVTISDPVKLAVYGSYANMLELAA